jgi:sodium-dependent dicarboxylate transporter 2/3/5
VTASEEASSKVAETNDSAGWSRTRLVGLVLGPGLALLTLLLPPFGGLSLAGQSVVAATAWIAVWWITEAIPIPVTSLLPLVLLPVLGAMPGKVVASQYAGDPIFLFLGGFLLAIAIERCALHRRIAVGIIRVMGMGPSRAVLGFMLASAFLSMWISNTATTLMMLPIALAVIGTLQERLSDERQRANLAVGLLLGVAWGSSLGGIATPVGTPPNVVFLGLYDRLYEAGPRISFSQWIFAFLPLTIVGLPVAWLLLTRVFYPAGRAAPATGDGDGLPAQDGPMTADQARVLAVFAGTALLWITRANVDLGFATLPGWSNLLGDARGMVTDGTVAVFSAGLLFLLPSANRENSRTLLRWRDSRDVPWGILLLFGGGFAIAHAFKETGVSKAIGDTLHQLDGLPILLLILLIALAVTHLTEITSNTATTTVLVPIAAAASIPLDVHPLVVMLPVTLAASCAFMLPVATPPNAIVFGSGKIRMGQMLRPGIVLNLITAVLIALVIQLVATRIFHIEPREVPDWARVDVEQKLERK